MPAKKTTKDSTSDKPKRTLNPIIKAMNDYRNNVIAEHVGSKAPRKTSPVFKITLAAARTELGLDDKDKNTIEVVNKAQSIFEGNVSKYLKMAEVAQAEEAANPKPKKETKKKQAKGQKEEEETTTKSKKKQAKGVKEEDKTTTKSKKKQAKVVDQEEQEDQEDQEVQVVQKKQSKGKKNKAKEIVVQSESEADSDSDSESDSDSDGDF